MPVYVLPEVSNGTWAMSMAQPGVILTGVDVWRQRVMLVLNTPLGSDPLRPLFGCDYHQYIDQGVLTAGPLIEAEIVTAINTWVPEVVIVAIKLGTGSGTLNYNITLSIDGSVFNVALGSGGVFVGLAGTRIVNAGYKWWWSNVTPTLVVNGVPATPSVPASVPWSDVNGMIAWIRANWGAYGTWGLGKDEVILYCAENFDSVVLTMSLIS